MVPVHPRCRCCYAPWTYTDRKEWAKKHPEENPQQPQDVSQQFRSQYPKTITSSTAGARTQQSPAAQPTAQLAPEIGAVDYVSTLQSSVNDFLSKVKDVTPEGQTTHVYNIPLDDFRKLLPDPGKSGIMNLGTAKGIEILGKTLSTHQDEKKQEKHLAGTERFLEETEKAQTDGMMPPSVFFPDVELYETVMQHIGKCETAYENNSGVSEFIVLPYTVGMAGVLKDGAWVYQPTNKILIRHSKRGWHAFPVVREDDSNGQT